MNKKQVAAFLKVMSKDDTRPVLCAGYVDKFDDKVALVATDGYKLSAVYLDEDAEELVGKLVRRSAFERWYKLASNKDIITGEELKRISSEDFALNDGYLDAKFPEWQNLVPKREQEPQASMHFNAEFFKIVQDLNGDDSVHVQLYGMLAPMVVKSDKAFSMVMPMKR